MTAAESMLPMMTSVASLSLSIHFYSPLLTAHSRVTGVGKLEGAIELKQKQRKERERERDGSRGDDHGRISAAAAAVDRQSPANTFNCTAACRVHVNLKLTKTSTP